MSGNREPTGLEVAILGMSGAFPGAPALDDLWRNVAGAVESVTFFSREELLAAGVPAAVVEDPSFVPAAALLPDVDQFDALHFGLSPREAESMDPQQRLFLEHCWQALEDGGYDPRRAGGRVGVYGGAGINNYLLTRLLPSATTRPWLRSLQTLMGNEKDYLCTRVAYELGLEGPAVTVQTACSTSLVAVHLACQALIDGDCEMALAGGVSVDLPGRLGYLYQREGILSPDGHCRAYDERGQGTLFGSGVGVVLLKRLEDARAHGDRVRAVVLGSSINNDGSSKVGFSAPRAEGQARVIRAAHRSAGIDPATISSLEGHGTGTSLGDPIELDALRQAFGSSLPESSCALGSVKSNVGHLDTAAGAVGLIKTVLALEARQLPPSLHFERAHPRLGLEGSPFYVNTELKDWPGDSPRRAGVSSFGMGGTNAHVVLEEATPERTEPQPERPWQLLVWSARTPAALEQGTKRLADHLSSAAAPGLADASYTLQRGRTVFEHRRILVARDPADAAGALHSRDPERLLSWAGEARDRELIFLFPGQGTQHPGMGRQLYRTEPSFRREIDRCAEVLGPLLGFDPRELLHAESGDPEAAQRLTSTAAAQPLLLMVELSLAALWREWGVEPAAMLGHSVGEYAAAVLAGVLTLEEGLALVSHRGRLMQAQPTGRMLALGLSAQEALPRLPRELSLAAVNGPRQIVVAGPGAVLTDFAAELEAEGVDARWLRTSHAFHSLLMEPAVGPFRAEVAKVRLQPPKRPFLSNVTGTWITTEEATDPDYWARQLRQTVRFGDGLATLFGRPDRVLLEVGPGGALSALVRSNPDRPAQLVSVTSLPRPNEQGDESAHLLGALGRLWLAGVEPSWEGFHRPARRRRVALPTYPFERRRHWLGPPPDRALPTYYGLGDPDPHEEAAGLAQIEPLPTPESSPPSDPQRSHLGTAFQAPESATEQALCGIWRELLGVPEVGTHDDFLELGGHSLMATQLVARIESQLGVGLALSEVFAAPTVARQARLIESRLATGEPSGIVTLSTLVADLDHRHEPFPLNEVQQAYWVGRGSSFELGNVATHVYAELEAVELDLSRLERAYAGLIERHEMLRAVIDAQGRQRILTVDSLPSAAQRITVLDLRAHPQAEAELARLREELSHQVLPADTWPLFSLRATLLPGGRTRLHVSFDFLIGDAWSIHLLSRELVERYLRPEQVFAPIAASFRDYVLAEEASRQGVAYTRALAYWRQRLAELPAGPDLPLACSPETLQRPRFVRRSGSLAAERWASLRRAAAGHGLTPSALLLSAYAEVLARWSASARFLICLTLFRRPPVHPEIGAVVGDFTSLILLEVDGSMPGTFVERARRLQALLIESLEHQAVSGVRVLRELAQARGGRAPRVPVVFTSTLGLDTGQEQHFSDLFETVYSVSQTPQVWLDHQVGEHRGALAWSWDAVDELFPLGMLDEMLASYQGLLEEMATDPEAWDRPTDLLGPVHLAARRSANDTGSPAVVGLLHEPFLARAAEAPEAPAVVTEDRTLSYGELARRAASLAWRLHELGVSPDQLVAVVMEKGWEQVVAVLAVLEAGGAYLPIDAGLPAERRHHLLERGEVRVALTQPGLSSALDWPSGIRVLAVDAEPGADLAAPPPVARGTSDLAYVIFTSGSTGQPKGVMIDHGAALNTILDINRRFRVGPQDRVLALSSLSFDLSVWDVFGLLAAGGTVVLPEPAAHRSPARWLELMADAGVTMWNSVPALLEMAVDHAAGSGTALPSTLRIALLSGDWVPVSLPARAWALRPELELVSLGGATEASIWSIAQPIAEVDPHWTSIPYGRPLANQQMHVVDEDLADRPTWVPGQLLIGGSGLARGYWRDEALTNASFFRHPQTGERLYRTGDLARYWPDGTLEFLGRQDHQVKIQGYRIELGEIETALLGHPGVTAAVANAVGPRHHRRLVGYVVGAPGLDDEALRRHLGERLPAYMVPPVILVLDALPLSANGKVDRAALPVPGGAVPMPVAAAVNGDARTARLDELWREVLGVPAVSATDNFFSLGGDSILAIQLASRAQAVGLPLSVELLFENPVLADLAARLSSEVASPPQPAVEATDRAYGPVPLMPIQHWFFELDLAHPEHWNQAALLSVPADTPVSALAGALDQLVVHHDALRLRFTRGSAGWQSFNAATAEVGLVTFDLAGLSPQEQRRQIETAGGGLHASLDLDSGPLFRSALFELGPQRGRRLLLVAHHLVIDGISWRLLLEDLATASAQLAAGGATRLPARTSSYRSWAIRWTEEAWSGRFEESLSYWLAEPRRRVTPLPVDHAGKPGPPLESSSGSLVRELDVEATGRLLRELPGHYHCTLQELLLTAFARSLRAWTGSELVLVDLETHGREEVPAGLDLTRTVGWFSAVFPLLLALGQDAPATRDLALVKEQLRGVPNGGVGYGLLRYLNPKPAVRSALATLPQAEVAFNYLGQFDAVLGGDTGLEAAAEASGAWSAGVNRRTHALFFHASVISGRLTLGWVYCRDRFLPSTVEALAASFEASLAELEQRSQLSRGEALAPSDFPLAELDQQQLAQVLEGFELEGEP
ncbi:MAG TPA: amino acid adenylation domain-containing protein [Thermoanaerobaculia bacterium]|nr:amino acid adenylation domain-containing protein [Thermoanaerobaculia bacterium]